jgi:SAM-dependent methyltransferase
VTELNESAAAAGRMWGGADYERMAREFAPIHDDLVARLRPQRGERWLDVGTGTGEVALRAARAGADVAAIDISNDLLELARTKRDAEHVRWELGDAQSLKFADGVFDVVSSCFAVIFAPDQVTAARELARVCRSGGRLGLIAWRPSAGPSAVYERFAPSDGYKGWEEWGKEERVEEWLGNAFDLEFEEGVWHITGDSPEAVWELMTEGAPPLKALLGTLEPRQREEFREAMLDYWRGFDTGDGVDEPQNYLIVEGRRR